MRNLKKFLALVLTVMMVFSLMITANAASAAGKFDDEDKVDAKFAEAVDVLSGIGIMVGNDGKFNPADTLTRAEAATIMYHVITGDVDNEKVKLYTEYGNFPDVSKDDWYAGYVGYCANAGVIKGTDEGKFEPYLKIDGYQMLAMLLRAIGYQNLEVFSGANWRVQVASGATLVGLLKDVNETRYGGNLYAETRRDVVASMTFQAIQKPQVIDNGMGGYTEYDRLVGGDKNPTLGEYWFGLTSIRSAIIGNKATGEKATRLGFGSSASGGNRVYDEWGYPVIVIKATGVTLKKGEAGYGAAFESDGTLKDTHEYLVTATGGSSASGEISFTSYGDYDVHVDFATGLDQFAHEATVWYNANSKNDGVYHAYALIDHNTSDKAFYKETNVGTTKISQVAGIADSKTALWSDRYSKIGSLAGSATTNISPVSTYRKVVNPNGTVYIALSAEVARVTQANTTAKDSYLILGTDDDNETSFMNDKTNEWILQKQLTSDTEAEQKKAGALVTAYEVLGTKFALSEHTNLTSIADTDPGDGSTWIGNVMYKLAPIETKTVTVKSYQKDDGLTLDTSASTVVVKVTPTEGDALEVSGITLGNKTKSKIISKALPIVTAGTQATGVTTELRANITYTAYLDIAGRFISMVPADDYKFLYGTYADYVIGGLGTGTIGYNMVGVDWTGKIQGENPVKSLTLNENADGISGIHDLTGSIAAIDGPTYQHITTTKKNQGVTTGGDKGNEIEKGYDTGYMYNAVTGDLAEWEGDKMASNDSWIITAQDARNGFKKVTANGKEWLLTKDTRFIIVDGTGTATLKAREAAGLTGLLNGATSAEIQYKTNGSSDGSWNEVIFLTEASKYGTMFTGNNGVITDVILSEGNLNLWNVQNLYYDFNQTSDTGARLAGASSDVKQYELWCGGKSDTYFIDTTLGDGSALDLTTGGAADSLFFTLSEAYSVSGTPVYKVTKASAIVGTAGAGGVVTDGFSAQGTTYDYVTVTNVHTGEFTKNGDSVVLGLDDVIVCDVQYKTDSAVANTRNEIDSVAKLNHAVSVGKHDLSSGTSDPNYTIKVAVVYDANNANATVIYVLDVATA